MELPWRILFWGTKSVWGPAQKLGGRGGQHTLGRVGGPPFFYRKAELVVGAINTGSFSTHKRGAVNTPGTDTTEGKQPPKRGANKEK